MFKILALSQYLRIAPLALLAIPTTLWAQANKSIKLISYRTENSVLLRWAPTSASVWLALNKSGYTLERYTIIRDSSRVYPPEKLMINNNLVPEELSSWELVARDNDYAAIMAQAIYGNSFETQLDNNGNGVLRAIQISKEQELRFSYSLLAADQSFEVAQMASLGFEDIMVNANESYLYKLYGSSGTIASDTAYALVDIYIKTPLPSISEIDVDFLDKKVDLRWRIDYLKEAYSSYDVEKSYDSIHFKPINHLANITTTADESKSLKWMIKSDSLEQNGSSVYYRVRGRTPFGIKGPYSEIIKGEGYTTLTKRIGIRTANEVEGGVLINWKAEDDEGLIENILIERSGDNKVYSLIDSVPRGAKSFLDLHPLSSNYYKIIAIGGRGERIVSLPYFIQLEDSIAPIVPVGLMGYCDTTGLVTLTWNRVEDSEIVGFRIFRSRVRDSEYRQLTTEPVNDTIYTDTVNLFTLSKKVYYKILAVDNRGNKSNLSKEHLVNLRDIVVPIPPRIIGFDVRSDTVEIRWENSSSEDLEMTKIYSKGEANTVLIKEVPKNAGVNKFLDISYYKNSHFYFLTAIDSAGNESERSNTIKIDRSPIRSKYELNLTVKVDRSENLIRLNWDLTRGVEAYKLYKSKDDSPISLLKVLSKEVSDYNDEKLELNSKYNYLLQVITEDSEDSFFSKQIKVVY